MAPHEPQGRVPRAGRAHPPHRTEALAVNLAFLLFAFGLIGGLVGWIARSIVAEAAEWREWEAQDAAFLDRLRSTSRG